MEEVLFPSLGISVKISKIAFNILGIDIYWYSICIVLGIIVAFVLCKISSDKFNIEFEDIVDVATFSIVFGFIGARLYYVLFNLDYYLEDIKRIVYIRDGGLAIYGGIIFGLIAMLKRANKLKIDKIDLLDYVAPFVAIAQSFGRWGNFFNIEAYGNQTSSFFRMGINSIHGYIEVHPTFLYESFATFCIFCILRILQKNRKFNGQIALLYFMLYSFIRFFIEGLRVDSLMLLNFRVSQVLSFIIFIIASSIYIKKSLKMRKIDKIDKNKMMSKK